MVGSGRYEEAMGPGGWGVQGRGSCGLAVTELGQTSLFSGAKWTMIATRPVLEVLVRKVPDSQRWITLPCFSHPAWEGPMVADSSCETLRFGPRDCLCLLFLVGLGLCWCAPAFSSW